MTWSTKVQGIKTLDLSREIRFSDNNMLEIIKKSRLTGLESFLEIGCGPGTFTRALNNHHQGPITGIDLDANFIDYARSRCSDVTYVLGNALDLPFEDESFDVVSSHTVVEHLETKAFITEQYRILKPGGKLLVMSVRTEGRIASDYDERITVREEALMKKVLQVLENLQASVSVCDYDASPKDIMKTMQLVGFKEIGIEVVPYLEHMASDERSFISDKESLLEYISSAQDQEEVLTNDELIELRHLVETRYKELQETQAYDFRYIPMFILIGIK